MLTIILGTGNINVVNQLAVVFKPRTDGFCIQIEINRRRHVLIHISNLHFFKGIRSIVNLFSLVC